MFLFFSSQLKKEFSLPTTSYTMSDISCGVAMVISSETETEKRTLLLNEYG